MMSWSKESPRITKFSNQFGFQQNLMMILYQLQGWHTMGQDCPDVKITMNVIHFESSGFNVQQGLEICGLKKCGPQRYTVFDWIPKHLRYTDFGQKP